MARGRSYRHYRTSRKMLIFWLVLYSLIIISLMFLIREPCEQPINFTLFSTIKQFWSLLWLRDIKLFVSAVINLAGNVIMFIPLGVLMPAIWRLQRRWYICLPTCALIIAFLEFMQYFTKLGTADIDDLLLNMGGVLIGFIIYKLTERK